MWRPLSDVSESYVNVATLMDKEYPVYDTKLHVLLFGLKFEDVTVMPVDPILIFHWYSDLYSRWAVKRYLKPNSVKRYVRHYQAKRRAAFNKKFSRSKIVLFFEGIYEIVTWKV